MKISVLICLYNSSEFILETLSSVFAQSYDDFEIIAVDDGSTDDCAELVKSNYQDPRLKIYRKTNEGLAKSRNFCLKKASGDYYAFLDHDDIWEPRKLELQVDAINRCNDRPYITFGDHEIIDSAGTSRTGKGETQRVHWRLTDDLFETFLINGNVICLSTILVYRGAFEDGLEFDDYKVAEEYDLWLKISHRHPSYAFVPEVVTRYRVHEHNATKRFAEESYQEEIEILMKWSQTLRGTDYWPKFQKNLSMAKIRYGHWLLGQNRVAAAKCLMREAVGHRQCDAHILWGWCKAELYGVKSFFSPGN